MGKDEEHEHEHEHVSSSSSLHLVTTAPSLHRIAATQRTGTLTSGFCRREAAIEDHSHFTLYRDWDLLTLVGQVMHAAPWW